MLDNPILDELYRIRETLSERFDGDVFAIGKHLRQRQAERGASTVTRPKKPPIAPILTTKPPGADHSRETKSGVVSPPSAAQ